MGHWNQRVIRKPTGDEDGGCIYEIHEVYYDDKGQLEPWTENPVQPFGDSPTEPREDIRWFLQACRRPIAHAAPRVDLLVERQAATAHRQRGTQQMQRLILLQVTPVNHDQRLGDTGE
jgi:hypothetical protein